jgi:hypothetical protein
MNPCSPADPGEKTPPNTEENRRPLTDHPVEWVRTYLWPCAGWVHESGSEQHAGTLDLSETAIEFLLRDMGFRRNPVAWLKTRSWAPLDSDGVSEGSWVLRRGFLAPMQLHITLFSNDDGTHDVLAHYEPSWQRHPIRHLRQGDLYLPEAGVRQIRVLFAEKGVDLE